MAAQSAKRVYLDLTHLGRHVTGIERVSIEQFEKVAFENAEVITVRSNGVLSMILRQQVLLPWLALRHPKAQFIFPGFPPSALFALARERVHLYVHDTFLITRTADLSTKALLYMAPQFKIAVRRLKHFFVNSHKTRSDLESYTAADAVIALYRPSVANHFRLSAADRANRPAQPQPLKLVALGTVEPRKNYAAALAILDAIRARHDRNAELHIIGRTGWGEDAAAVSAHPGVTVHGYLAADAVKQVLESCDMYLCTSHDEGLGLPLLESQFAGLPVIAPDQPVFREVLATSGTFVDPASPRAAADSIVAMTTRADWRRETAEAAIQNVTRWNEAAAHDLALARTTFASPAGDPAPTALSAARPV
jgi:glycosyltransferase involved in cell wall biosynthesis